MCGSSQYDGVTAMRKLRLSLKKRTILIIMLGVIIGVAVGSSSLPFWLQLVVIVVGATLMVIAVRKLVRVDEDEQQ
jgi:membrane protein implicated in regulation of membrane protease activity